MLKSLNPDVDIESLLKDSETWDFTARTDGLLK
jgi:hypothetical protein